MKMYIILSIALLLMALFICTPVYGQESTQSAEIEDMSSSQEIDLYDTETYLKKRAIMNVFEKNNSPLRDEVDTFIELCLAYQLDCYLLPAIAGVESSYGHAVAPGTYNPFGWGGGSISFSSWEEGIRAVAEGLHKNYISDGLVSIEQIGTKYAASYTWALHIQHKRQEFVQEEAQLQLYFEEITVQ